MKMYVRLECVPVLESAVHGNYTKKIRWENIKNDQLKIYKVATSELLKKICMPTDALSCKNMNCRMKITKLTSALFIMKLFAH